MPEAQDDEFARFVADAGPRLLWTARLLRAGDHAAADDLLQDALIETYRRWSRIRDVSARYAYAHRILVRTATKRWKAQSRMLELITPDAGAQAYASLPDSDSRMDVWSALADLSPRQRAVVVLRYYEDLTEEQIADVVGCSRGSVKTHTSRAMKALAGLLADHDPAPQPNGGEPR